MTRFLGPDREALPLRERRCFEAEAEAAEITSLAVPAGVAGAVDHCLVQLGLGHAVPVVNERDVGVHWVLRGSIQDPDVLGACGN